MNKIPIIFYQKTLFQKKQNIFSILGEQISIFEPIFTFFEKIALSCKKIVQTNMFPKEIKNLAKKKKGQAQFSKKWMKRGYFFGQNFIFERVFTCFHKNRVVL